MLAQSFQSAADLGITEPQKEALMKTLVLLETGKLLHVPAERLFQIGREFTGHFNMDSWCWEGECGTIACIAGTAELIGGIKFGAGRPAGLTDLFFPYEDLALNYGAITTEQASRALRSYLTHGDAKWSEAVA